MSSPFTVVSPEFLRWLAERDEAQTASEADLAGPWRILQLPGGEHGLFRIGEHPDRGDLPAASFIRYEDALLAAAVFPGTGRDPLYRLRTEPGPEGSFPVEADGDVVGRLQLFNPDVTAALHVLGCVLRSPAALAGVLAAASGVALERAGRILAASAEPAPTA
jgi:hypothetical protein